MNKAINLVSVGHSYVVALNRSILREIAKDPDFDVTVIAPSLFKGSLRSIPIEPEPEGSGLAVKAVDAYLTQKMHIFSYNGRQLRQAFSQGQYDLLHLWEEPYILSGFQVAKMAHKQGLPFCIRTAQSLVKKYIFPFNHFERKVFSWCQAWIAGGHLVHEAMVKKGWGTSKGKVLSLGVNTDRFLPFNEQQRTQKQKELNLEGPLVGYLGRLSEEKGLDLLMEVMGSLKEQKWSLLMMGSGPYEEKIKRWINERGLQDRVRVALFAHDEIPQVLPACELLLCPSQTRPFWKEQFGRMVVEAFASGVPVVASDSGEIPRVVDEAGVILPEKDKEVWSKTIKELLLNADKREAMREMGLKRAQEYSVKKVAEQYKVFYRKILEDSQRS